MNGILQYSTLSRLLDLNNQIHDLKYRMMEEPVLALLVLVRQAASPRCRKKSNVVPGPVCLSAGSQTQATSSWKKKASNTRTLVPSPRPVRS